jgi:hypothetical protein
MLYPAGGSTERLQTRVHLTESIPLCGKLSVYLYNPSDTSKENARLSKVHNHFQLARHTSLTYEGKSENKVPCFIATK